MDFWAFLFDFVQPSEVYKGYGKGDRRGHGHGEGFASGSGPSSFGGGASHGACYVDGTGEGGGLTRCHTDPGLADGEGLGWGQGEGNPDGTGEGGGNGEGAGRLTGTGGDLL